MKKLLLSVIAAAGVLAVNAATPTLNWAYAIDSSYANDQIGGIVTTTDGKVVTYSHLASQNDNDKLTYNGENIGAPVASLTENRNLVVIKHNADGTKAWAVTSKKGYFDAGNGSIVATNDGGVLVYAKPRSWQSKAQTFDQPQLIDATGAEIDFPDFPYLKGENTSAYNSALIKISSEGTVEWVRNFETSELPFEGETKAATDAITPNAVTVDGDGNIFVGGNFRAATLYKGEKYSNYITLPRNATSSSTSGGLYLVKLNKDGEWLDQVSVSGTATRDQISSLAYADGKIYFAGNVQGAANNVIKVGDKSITLENDLDGILYGSVRADSLGVDYVGYVKAFGSTDDKHTTQIKALRLIDGNLYVLGSVKGGFGPAGSSAAVASSETTTLDSFFIKLSAADGSWAGAHTQSNTVDSKYKVSCYFDIFKNNDKLYAFGYALDSTLGVFVDELGSDLSVAAKQSLVLGGGSPTTAAGVAFNSTTGDIVVSARGNKEFTFYGSENKIAPIDNKFGAVLASFNLEGKSGVSDATTNSVASYSADKHSVIVKASEETDVTVYNTAGVKVAAQKVAPGTTHIALPAGIYIVNNTKLIVG
jgi:hypothetical protein